MRELGSPPAVTVAGLPLDPDLSCPECGQALWRRAPSAPPPPARHPGWSWLLVAAGVYLVVTFGTRAWGAHLAMDVTDRGLPQLIDCPPDMPGLRVGEPDCQTTVVGGSVRALAIQTSRGLVQRQMDRGLLVVAAGLLAVLVGLGILVRGQGRVGPRRWLPATLLGLWAFGEDLVLALFCLFLGGCGYLLLGQLIAGGPLTWAFVDQTAQRVVALILDVAQIG